MPATCGATSPCAEWSSSASNTAPEPSASWPIPNSPRKTPATTPATTACSTRYSPCSGCSATSPTSAATPRASPSSARAPEPSAAACSAPHHWPADSSTAASAKAAARLPHGPTSHARWAWTPRRKEPSSRASPSSGTSRRRTSSSCARWTPWPSATVTWASAASGPV